MKQSPRPQQSSELVRRWTAAEDDLLRASYTKSGAAKQIAQEIGRSLIAVCRRARRLGVYSHPRWTPDDDRRLRNLWGEHTLRGVARSLGRTIEATYQHAKEIGLPMGCPDGAEYLTHAAKRTGYDIASLRNILRRSGVPIRRTMSRPLGKRVERPCHFVDPFDVDEAIAAWLKTETPAVAARRLGFDERALKSILAGAEGVPPKPEGKIHWRIPSDVIDRVVAGGGRKAA